MNNDLLIFTDGGARGNPGPAATGVYITDTQGSEVAAFGMYIGETTNNVAEYKACIQGLEKALALGASNVTLYADSKLLVEQLNRNWKVKDLKIQKLFLEAWKLLQQFTTYKLVHIPREQNKKADAQVNLALDTRE